MPLDPALQRMQEDLTRQISEKLDIATASWKENKLLDIETTEAIVSRVQSWAKLFGFFVAIPLILISVWLGLLGYKSYSDFEASIARGQVEIDQKLKAAKGSIDSLQGKANDLSSIQTKITSEQAKIDPKLQEAARNVAALQGRASQLSALQSGIAKEQADLGPQLKVAEQRVSSLAARQGELSAQQDSISREEKSIDPLLKKTEQDVVTLQSRETEVSKQVELANQLVPEFKNLSERVDSLQSQIAIFEQSPELTAQRQRQIVDELSKFRAHLIMLGFSPPKDLPKISVSKGRGASSILAENSINIGSATLDEPSSYLWVYADVVLMSTPGKFRGDGDYSCPYSLILDHYFSASFLGKRSDVQVTCFRGKELRYDWVAVCWNIREAIGADAADAFFATLFKKEANRQGSESFSSYFPEMINKTAKQVKGGKYSSTIKAILSGTLPEL